MGWGAFHWHLLCGPQGWNFGEEISVGSPAWTVYPGQALKGLEPGLGGGPSLTEGRGVQLASVPGD